MKLLRLVLAAALVGGAAACANPTAPAEPSIPIPNLVPSQTGITIPIP